MLYGSIPYIHGSAMSIVNYEQSLHEPSLGERIYVYGSMQPQELG
jgi:hypothetical protein